MPAHKTIVIRVSALTHAAVKLQADEAGQSMQTYIERLLCRSTDTSPIPKVSTEMLRKTIDTLRADASTTQYSRIDDDSDDLGSPYKGASAAPKPLAPQRKLSDIAAEWDAAEE